MKKNCLKELRTGQGISQKDLAEKLGVSQQTIASWEVDRTEPSNDFLKSIADFFEVSADYLLGRPTSFSLPRNEQRLLTDYNSLTAEGKQTLQNVLSGLKMKYSVGRQVP